MCNAENIEHLFFIIIITDIIIMLFNNIVTAAINLKELDPGLPHSSSMQSLAMEIIEPNLDDSFQKEVKYEFAIFLIDCYTSERFN